MQSARLKKSLSLSCLLIWNWFKFSYIRSIGSKGLILLELGQRKHTIFYIGVGFIGIAQSSHIFFNSIFNTFPFLYKFESLGFQMQSTDKGGRVGTGRIQ